MNLSEQHIADIPSYIFGQSSSLHPSLVQSGVVASAATLPYIYMALIVVSTALYLLWINYWSSRGNNYKLLFGFLGYHRGDYSLKVEIASSPLFSRYLSSGGLVYILMLWIAAISLLGLTQIYLLDQAVKVLLAILAILAYKAIAIKLIGLVLNTQEFAKAIFSVRGIAHAISALLVTPVILCLALAKSEIKYIFVYIVAFQLFIALVIFIYETFLLFLSKKVSLLHTILYLCTVEIFPITLIWGFFNR